MVNNSNAKEKKNKYQKNKRSINIVESAERSEENFKKSNSNFNLLEVVIIMIMTSLFGILIGWFICYINNNDKSETFYNQEDVNEIIKVYDNLVNEYYDDVDKNELIIGAISGMMNSLNDPYSVYIDPDYADTFNDELTGSFIGIGVEIVLYENSLPIVVNVLNDTPASSAGIMVNDLLYKINDKDISNFSIDDITSMIKEGNINEEVKITVLRDNIEKEFVLKRKKIEIESVFVNYYNTGDNMIGIITISKFAKNSLSQFEKIYNEALDNNVDSLIIDVRNNNGGYLSVAKNISSLFLDKGSIVYQTIDNENIEVVKSEVDKKIDKDVVLLVNENTASAAEVFVSALKDNLGVYVVGAKTYGKGTIQKLVELFDDSYIKYTVQKLLTPKGNEINGVGILPDYVIDIDDENDTQLSFALELLSKGE